MAVLDVIARGQEQHRSAIGLRTQGLHDAPAVLTRQHDVQNSCVEAMLAQQH